MHVSFSLFVVAATTALYTSTCIHNIYMEVIFHVANYSTVSHIFHSLI